MTDRDRIEALLARYSTAYQRGDAAGCAAIFTEDAMMMSPFGPVAQGRAQIAAQHVDWTGAAAPNKQVTIESFGQAGDLAWCLARFSDGPETGDGLTLSVLERQPDGDWLIRMCSLNEATPDPG